MEIREAESEYMCVGRVRVCLSGKREGGKISARKLSLNKNKNFSVILPVQAMCQPSLQATC